jgi:hypothetical protein
LVKNNVKRYFLHNSILCARRLTLADGMEPSMKFRTRSLPCFNELLELFYKAGVKQVPANIAELLTPLGLATALWASKNPCGATNFQWKLRGLIKKVDGSFDKTRQAVRIYTDGFTLAEVKLLTEVLTNKFGLKCTINNRKGEYFRIRISKKSLCKNQLRGVKNNVLRYFLPIEGA